MLYPGQRVQIDIKFVPDAFIVGDAKTDGREFYQYTPIDEYSCFRYLDAYEEHRKATITDLLTEEQYAKASGMVQIASSPQYLISPFIAGILLSFYDIRLILSIDICTIIVTVITILLVNRHIKEKPHKKENFNALKDLKEGFASVIWHPGIRILVYLMSFACFTLGLLQTMLSPMVLSFTDSKSLGYLESLSAIGMLVGSVVIGVMSIKKNYCRVLFIGRAWGVISILSQFGYLLSYGLSGIMADHIFCLLLEDNGILANSVGRIFCTGHERGIGLR